MKASVAELAKLPGVWRGGEIDPAAQQVIATGHAPLDRELPSGGWPAATLSEVLHDGTGIGEVSFLAGALAQASQGERLVAWINPPHLPYAPALAQAGIALEHCLVIRPANADDALWAAEQALRSGACGAALLWMQKDDYAWMRRLQMAAQAGRCMAVLLRSTAAERQSTPAHLRVVLERDGPMLRIRIPKRRGPPLVKPVEIAAGLARRALPLPQARASALSPVFAFPQRPRAIA